MSNFFELGRIVRLQIAPEVPKLTGPEGQAYDPTPLLQVEELLLTQRGVAGRTYAGRYALDVHHQNHPRSRFRGDNALSLGFTSHYSLMRRIFGAHIIDGCAAENILVRADERLSIEEAPAWMVIESLDGARLDLGQPIVAEPCAPFARWALADEAGEAEPEEVRHALQKLRRGTRGFYGGTVHVREPFRVRVGYRVLMSREPPHQGSS